MSVLEDWTNAAVMLIVLTLLGVTHADVMMVILEMAFMAIVSIVQWKSYDLLFAIIKLNST